MKPINIPDLLTIFSVHYYTTSIFYGKMIRLANHILRKNYHGNAHNLANFCYENYSCLQFQKH